MKEVQSIQEAQIWELLESIPDPEIPVISIVDLGIIRSVHTGPPLQVLITPTYSGCPAMDMIESQVQQALKNGGYPDAEVKTVLSPAWTTDWLTEHGKQKLREYGIAPPITTSGDKRLLMREFAEVPCPRCQSKNTKLISEFGSTPCKSLFQCQDCLEPFDYFKCH